MVREIEEQHPIPQDISSYQFRLVGDMTLRQFLQVAAGALIALFLYASPLNPFVKWPLILISVLFGVALAFMPIDDRPLGTWIIAFFRSIYNPTIFVWKIAVKPINYFKTEPKITPAVVPAKKVFVPRADIPPAITERAAGTIYLSKDESKALSSLEKKEESFLAKITNLFSMPSIAKVPARKPVRLTPAAAQAEKVSKTLNVTLSPAPQQKIAPPPIQAPSPDHLKSATTKVSPTLAKSQQISGIQGQFSQDGTAPEIPTTPNIVVGQVLDSKGLIVESAILEIKDDQGRPVRALKTNKLGHFMIVTPLMDGKYEITTEKEGLEFEKTIFDAEGKIVPPVLIKAKREIKNGESV
jgi:hypothetical protein